MSILTDSPAAVATGVAITAEALVVDLADGRSVAAPLGWYPRLQHATEAERTNWRLVGDGEGVHWPDLDEDIRVAALLAGMPSAESPESLARWMVNRRG